MLGINEFQFFIKAIPYNLYAITTLVMVLCIIVFKRDFGPMKQSELLAAKGQLYNEKKIWPVSGNVPDAEESRAKAI